MDLEDLETLVDGKENEIEFQEDGDILESPKVGKENEATNVFEGSFVNPSTKVQGPLNPNASKFGPFPCQICLMDSSPLGLTLPPRGPKKIITRNSSHPPSEQDETSSHETKILLREEADIQKRS